MLSPITKHETLGISAFTSQDQLVMNCGVPIVQWSFRIEDLEEWLITLEEVMLAPRMHCHRRTLETLYFSLKAALARHQKQHHDVVLNAEGPDLMAYLHAYMHSNILK